MNMFSEKCLVSVISNRQQSKSILHYKAAKKGEIPSLSLMAWIATNPKWLGIFSQRREGRQLKQLLCLKNVRAVPHHPAIVPLIVPPFLDSRIKMIFSLLSSNRKWNERERNREKGTASSFASLSFRFDLGSRGVLLPCFRRSSPLGSILSFIPRFHLFWDLCHRSTFCISLWGKLCEIKDFEKENGAEKRKKRT